jgi:hypothetical protein
LHKERRTMSFRATSRDKPAQRSRASSCWFSSESHAASTPPTPLDLDAVPATPVGALYVQICSWNMNGRNAPDADLALWLALGASKGADNEVQTVAPDGTHQAADSAGGAQLEVGEAGSSMRSSEGAPNEASERLPPDVIVVGCQEFTALNAQQLLPQLEKKREFQRKIVATLTRMHGKTYTPVHPRHLKEVPPQLAGLLTLLFVRDDSALRVQGAQSVLVPTGLGGLSGNKGGIAFRVTVAGFPLLFVNVHLPSGSGKENKAQRDQAFADVLKGAASQFASGGVASALPTALEQHTTFCFGDFNYRLSMASREVRWRMSCRDWPTLLWSDQLLEQLGNEASPTYAAWDEADITFKPTYKYDVGAIDRFDTSEKARAPAWCDRVLWRVTPAAAIEPLLYDSCMHVVCSDHKPIKFLVKIAI